MNRVMGLALLLSACQAIGPGEDPPEKESEPRAARESGESEPAPLTLPLPDGFAVVGEPTVEDAYLAPGEAWRELRSRLTTVQVDARRWKRDVLVSFEPGAVHRTRRDGARTTWKLPQGLELEVRTPHVIVRSDLTLAGFLDDGTQVPAREEVTVAIVRWNAGGKQKAESRLMIKGGKAFRSMTPR